MYLSEIPGYIRAVARGDRLEDYWRDFVFLGLNEELHIAGGYKVTVRLLTLRMFVQLCAVRSPFLVGGEIHPEDVALLFWRLSPAYDTRLKGPKIRKKFMRSVAGFPFLASIRACNRYLDRMLIDRPPTSTGKSGPKIDTSAAASIIHQIASVYGWSDEQILDLPMPRLFQYMRRIHRGTNYEMPHFNPIRDRLVKRITDKVLTARNAQRGATNGGAS